LRTAQHDIPACSDEFARPWAGAQQLAATAGGGSVPVTLVTQAAGTRFHGIFSSSLPIAQKPVIPAKINPHATNQSMM
jgi:hypothetical protein